eukprot:6184574-Pleurochrysis_carterae.AAC.1
MKVRVRKRARTRARVRARARARGSAGEREGREKERETSHRGACCCAPVLHPRTVNLASVLPSASLGEDSQAAIHARNRACLGG